MNCFLCDYTYSEDKPKSIAQHIRNKHKEYSSQSYYDKFLKKDGEGTCAREGCENPCTFISIQKGYYKYCCIKCGSIDTRDDMKKACLEKFGVENILSLKESREKALKVRRRKRKEFLNEEEQKLIESIDSKNRCQCQICGKKYDTVDGTAKHVSRTHKMIVSDYYDKFFKVFDDEGICSYCKSKDNKTTFIGLKFGYYKYHEGCSISGPDNPALTKAKEMFRNHSINQLKIISAKKEVEILNWEEIRNFNNKHLYSCKLKLKCLKCNKTYETNWGNLYSKNDRWGRCPDCFPKYTNPVSNAEKNLHEYILSIYDKKIIRGSYGIIKDPKTGNALELDFYFPEENLAIEFDGLYWHSEKQKNRNYHWMKTKLCKEQNIRLIHIFEDEWLHKYEIVQSRLKHIFKIKKNVIFARKCQIKEIDSNEKNLFLNEHHIQGGDCSRIKLGAFSDDKLLGVMTFSLGNISKGGNPNNEFEWELSRFSIHSDYHIPGIAGKLLKYFQKNYKWTCIYSYADLRWSNGDLYKRLGFDLEKQIEPQYWYVDCYNIKRIHRFNLRKKSFENKDITERALREQEGYLRIWDCGLLKFTIINSNF